MNTFRLIQSDYKKYIKYGNNFFSTFFLTQGFWAVFHYRIAHFISTLKVPIVKQFLQLLCVFGQKIIEITTGISIPASVKIGHSFYIGHFGGIIINSNTIIGNNCNIAQGVTFGVSGVNENRGTPVIGDNVYIGANSVIVGKIKVGNNVLIGACSLVNSDVEDCSVMLGVPAKKVSNKGSEGYI
ncbi:MAG: serine acetyltransferase [Flavobacterium sp.]|uniref:serine O-acetyltransferase n=1 Tax=Flavobacterium sp. TaxID=239 RepID=UPI0022C92B80|nr:serine acetyltransferase [Flavobacterium sp.]MCZ8197285.1 serine acetyltransferase [Flavobacterium sp.]